MAEHHRHGRPIVGSVFYVLAGIGILVAFFTAPAAKTLALQAERRQEHETG